MIAIHYSRARRSELSSAYYGTGHRDAAKARVANEPRLVHRIHLYVARDGATPLPERLCGPVRHTAWIDDATVYCVRADRLGVVAWARRAHPANAFARANAMELEVMDAGYAGYLAPFGQCDALVLLGERTLPVMGD
jgi:hypothetical protein